MQKNSYLIISAVCFALVFAILFQGCFTKWETKDKVLFASFAGLQAVDTAQSWGIWDDPSREELNLCITSRESLVMIKALSTGIIYFIADWFKDQRTKILQVSCSVIAGGVFWNFTQ